MSFKRIDILYQKLSCWETDLLNSILNIFSFENVRLQQKSTVFTRYV